MHILPEQQLSSTPQSRLASGTQRRFGSLLLMLLAVSLLGTASSCKKEDTTPKVLINPGDTLPPIDTTQHSTGTGITVLPGNAVVYEAYVRAASSAGTFDGLTVRLDSIKRLGCNVLWLMPIHPIGVLNRAGSLGSPYSVRDYSAVSAEYGNMAAFDRLVGAAHDRKIAVVLDWVANHTAWDHAWITAHPDWYTHNAAGAIVAPQPDWLDVADLNYDNAAMRKEMIRSMKSWVTGHNIDGFRCDAADLVPDDFWRQALDTLRLVRSDLFLLAEGSKGTQLTAGFQMLYGWNFYNGLKAVFNGGNAPSLATTSNGERLQVPAGKYLLRFTTNHDFTFTEGGPTEIYGSLEAAKAAYVAMLAYGATPLIYNGQEVGDPTRLSLFGKSTINWNSAVAPPTSAFYRKVLNAYDSLPALRTGSIASASVSNDAVTVLRTGSSQDRVAVFANVRNNAITITVPTNWPATSWKDALTGQAVPAGTTLTLPAYGYAIWRN